MSRASSLARAFGADGVLNTSDVSGLGALAALNTVGTSQIDDSAITNAKLAADGLDASKLTTGTLAVARIADGAVTAAKLALGARGKILQVVSAVNNTNYTINPATTPAATFYDVGTSCSITPLLSSSTIFISVMQSYFHDSAGQGTGFRMVRGSTTISTEQGFTASYMGTQHRVHGYHPIMQIDSPNTTSSVTYKVQAAHWTTAGLLEYQYASAQSPSRIILMEVAA